MERDDTTLEKENREKEKLKIKESIEQQKKDARLKEEIEKSLNEKKMDVKRRNKENEE